MEAQRYPNDYDGIIAGAPANYFTHILTGFAWNMQATMSDPGSYIPASKLKALRRSRGVRLRCPGWRDGRRARGSTSAGSIHPSCFAREPSPMNASQKSRLRR